MSWSKIDRPVTLTEMASAFRVDASAIEGVALPATKSSLTSD